VSNDAEGTGEFYLMSKLVTFMPELCHQFGIRDVVISPGSRSALLTVSFARHSGITCHVVTDERSAAYVALGLAQQNDSPIALVCTSGTAALNYAPAVAEAYYLNVPLLVLTADRPPEWIGQNDGQSIIQTALYGPHVKQAFNLPVDTSHPDAQWDFFRQLSEAMNLCVMPPQGPVQINIPIREPFYSHLHEQAPAPQMPAKIIRELPVEKTLTETHWQDLLKAVHDAKRMLILSGQTPYDAGLRSALEALGGQVQLVIIGDILSNLHGTGALTHIDGVVAKVDADTKADLQPDLLLTLGMTTLPKNIKSLVRDLQVTQHWHIQEAGEVADCFQSLTHIIRLAPIVFFEELFTKLSAKLLSEQTTRCETDDVSINKDPSFVKTWQKMEQRSIQAVEAFMLDRPQFTEFEAIYRVIQKLPTDCDLHLGNSMPVRYANLVGLHQDHIRVFCNRGTSGIDGSMSTAVGHAVASNRMQVLIIGDVSFFYDRNALWREGDIPKNLRIVLVNNGGGGIFKLIDGPSALPELNRFFVTPQTRRAELVAQEHGLEYICCDDVSTLAEALESYFAPGSRAKLLEIVTDMEINTSEFQVFRQQLRLSSLSIVSPLSTAIKDA
jgi:2-succinyl-5-enolpyruvyl-6-hydroxy-3-cyclohexene-1-carboxylate synthase